MNDVRPGAIPQISRLLIILSLHWTNTSPYPSVHLQYRLTNLKNADNQVDEHDVAQNMAMTL